MVEIGENQLNLHCHSLKDLTNIARKIIEFTGKTKVIAFEGQLGAGKTTLIKQICLEVGVSDTITSPSFSIINEYLNQKGEQVYHFDFFRIKDLEEAVNIGTEEYFYSGRLCFLEWPLKVEDILPEEYTFVEIEVTGPESRIFHLKKT